MSSLLHSNNGHGLRVLGVYLTKVGGVRDGNAYGNRWGIRDGFERAKESDRGRDVLSIRNTEYKIQ